jgi:hypothetical protein
LFLRRWESPYVAQAGLELVSLSDPPASASQVAETNDVCTMCPAERWFLIEDVREVKGEPCRCWWKSSASSFRGKTLPGVFEDEQVVLWANWEKVTVERMSKRKSELGAGGSHLMMAGSLK